MKVVQINEFCGNGSTGKICVAVSERLTKQGIENYIFYTSRHSDYPLGKSYMRPFEVKFQALKAKVFGNFGFNSRAATRRLIAQLEELQPDVIHLHNLHGHNCNLQMLFQYLKTKKIRIFWTFHDCWAFTGYCPHYDMAGCGKWKTGCADCPQKKKYTWFFDRSHDLFEKKKELFSGLDMTIVTPSHWLAEQVKQSFLDKYEVRVIHNGINLSVFQPRLSDFREKYGCKDKYIVLGVANIWVYQKGLDVFIELSKRLDERFQIVMVGTDETVEQKLPDNIIAIRRTRDELELAEIYSAADVFVNPTRQEVLGLTNIEALACGTPVVTFQTGGSPECIDETCGVAVAKDDLDALEREIIGICVEKRFPKGTPFKRSELFDSDIIYSEYTKMYQ